DDILQPSSVLMNPSKQEWFWNKPGPTTAKLVKPFIGFVRLYPHFIRSLSENSLRPVDPTSFSQTTMSSNRVSFFLLYKSVTSPVPSPL
ncbi:hypothetical protein NHX12_001792, partial [Muraenolepis orangiensis]